MDSRFRAFDPKRSNWASVALIECELDCQRVAEHIAELAGCLEETEEEQKLALLVESFERWEQRRWPHLEELSSEDAFVPDDLSNRGAQDRARINLNEPHEVKYWTQKWGISAEQLKQAVARAGTSAAAVARQVGKPVE